MTCEYVGVKDSIGGGMFNMYITDEPIVRCRDCKKRDLDLSIDKVCPMDGYDPDGFCKWGERKDG